MPEQKANEIGLTIRPEHSYTNAAYEQKGIQQRVRSARFFFPSFSVATGRCIGERTHPVLEVCVTMVLSLVGCRRCDGKCFAVIHNMRNRTPIAWTYKEECDGGGGGGAGDAQRRAMFRTNASTNVIRRMDFTDGDHPGWGLSTDILCMYIGTRWHWYSWLWIIKTKSADGNDMGMLDFLLSLSRFVWHVLRYWLH